MGWCGLNPRWAPVHVGARAKHRPIQVDREPREAAALDLLVHQVADQVGKALEQGRREGLEPAHHGAVGRREVEPREAQEDRIRPHEGQLGDAQPPDHQEPDHEHRHPHGAEVAVERGVAEQRAQTRGKIDRAEVAPQQLEAPVGGDLLVRERDRKIALDAGANPPSTYSHECGPSVEEGWLISPSYPPTGPLSI